MTPCKKYGHAEGRRSNGSCVVCHRADGKARRKTPRGRMLHNLYQMRSDNKRADARDAALEAQLTHTKKETDK